jgi:formylglycine-generating enzyme required for sulfatase activity
MSGTQESGPGGKELPQGTRLEEFVIERVLGSGGFGITYLARDISLSRQVVIKENLPSQFAHRDTTSLTVHAGPGREDQENFRWSLENFSREGETLASLRHPGIVPVLRRFEAFGTAYFVMPYIEGSPLDVLLRERQGAGRPFVESELRVLSERVLDALGYLHERGIYHRDIKPGNILMTADGIPVLIDFGSARQRLSERSMTVVESAGYTPFEQLQSRGNVGPWSDLYALAATLVKVMTGEAPPKANDRTMGDPWQPLVGQADLEGRYSEIFLSCLDRALKLPIEDRWQGAEEWRAALESGIVAQAPGKAGQQVVPLAPARTKEAKPRRWPLAVAGALAFMLTGAWWLMQKAGSEAPVVILAPAPGGLVITSEPSGAELRGESRDVVGKTPVELTGLEAGKLWQGELSLKGYETAEAEAEVRSGETKLVSPVVLVPQAQKVVVSSEPTGAEVMEDGKLLGTTPWEGSPRAVGSKVALSLRKAGYDGSELKGEVAFGKTLLLQGKLKPTPQSIFVGSEPSGAEVLEGGAVIGNTPLELNGQTPGRGVVYQLRLKGYEEEELSGEVKVGEALRLSAQLREKPKPKLEGLKAGEERDFEIAPGVEMTFCWCPPGEFVMGSPEGELGREEDEILHRVRLTKGFWLGKYEVTQAQWLAAGGVDPRGREPATVDGEVTLRWSQLRAAGTLAANFKGDRLPVERVTWTEVNEWCESLRGGGGESDDPDGVWRYGLPTEAQWEYAARAGSTTALNSGKKLTSKEGKCENLDEVGWNGQNSRDRTHEVGGKKANAWGLHDMHGNVWEWCSDWYGEYPSGLLTDPRGAASGASRVGRGGGWGHYAVNCRVAYRGNSGPTCANSSIGFRVARSSVP